MVKKWRRTAIVLRVAWLWPLDTWKYVLERLAGPPRDENGEEGEDDRSYGDALLDLQMRLFFRREYGSAEPPAHLFQRVLWAIERHNHQKAAWPDHSRIPQALARSVQRWRSAFSSAAALFTLLTSNLPVLSATTPCNGGQDCAEGA